MGGQGKRLEFSAALRLRRERRVESSSYGWEELGVRFVKKRKASRERQAKVINAKGEFQAAQRLAEVSQVTEQHPVAAICSAQEWIDGAYLFSYQDPMSHVGVLFVPLPQPPFRIVIRAEPGT
jgi:hypothetical protein